MGLFKLTSSSSSGTSSTSGTYSEPPLQEVTQPVWKERKGLIGEWTLALVIAFLAALTIRTFFFEAFRIPSESMENTLVVGDFVLVSKVHYGSRVPTTLGLPFTTYYLDSISLPRWRLPGFGRIDYNDVIVFNVPREMRPVDRKTHYIKRVVALPGDSLRIQDKRTYINGVPLYSGSTVKYLWMAYPDNGESISPLKFKELGIDQINQPSRQGDPIRFEASQEVADQVARWGEIRSVEPVIRNSHFRERIFPSDRGYGLDNYGPLYIPKKGDVIKLTDENWELYHDIIIRHEGNMAVRIGSDLYQLNGEIAQEYTIQQDYYFVMGDNRDSSLDSRTWGYVPYDHVVGKALTVYFSWDAIEGKVRKDRILKGLD